MWEISPRKTVMTQPRLGDGSVRLGPAAELVWELRLFLLLPWNYTLSNILVANFVQVSYSMLRQCVDKKASRKN